MGIFEKFSSAIERKATDVSALTWSELFPARSAKSGVTVNVDTALRTTTVLACARVISEGIAQLPVKLFDIDGLNKTVNTTHPLYHLLACEPNDFMSSFEFREMMTMHAVLLGNAYAYVNRVGNKIIEILPLVPNQVSLVRNADWTIDYYVTDLAGKTMVLDGRDVLHLRGPMWNGYQGMDMVQTAREAIGLSIATEETHASLHANGAQPGGVLAVKGKLDDKARERLKTAWNAFQGGVANRFKTAVLDVDAEWKPLSMTGVDSQHLETRRFQIEEICRAMRVFPQLVMHSDKTSTFASAESFFIAHVTHSLMPWVQRWEQTINRVILDDDPKLVMRLNVQSMLKTDATTRGNFYQQALGGARPETAWMTKNEVRELEDLNPIDGGDELPKPPPVPDPTTPFGASPGADEPDPADDHNPVTAKALEALAVFRKNNPNHDESGRFASGPGVKGSGVEQATSVKRSWIASSPLRSLTDVYKGAEGNKLRLDAAGAAVAAETGAKLKTAPIKKIERAMEKVAAGRKPGGVNDIVRQTFHVASPAIADAVVKGLAKYFPIVDEGYKTTNAGYFDRAVNVKFPNGQIGEVLIMPPEMANAKSEGGGHKLYSGERSLPAGHPLRETLLAASRELYARANQRLSADWKDALGKDGS
jgi:HK97 family phage portal protein